MRAKRAWSRTMVVALIACGAVAAPIAGPAAAAGGTTPVVRVSLAGITCNPAGQAGLRASGSATVTGTSVRGAQLVVFEFQPISDPAFAPFPFTGSSVATWISEDSYRSAVAGDARTLDTTDRTTWNRGNYSKDIWRGSAADSWWSVQYTVTTSARTASQQHVSWYVSCPTGRIVDQAGLREIEQVQTTGLR